MCARSPSVCPPLGRAWVPCLTCAAQLQPVLAFDGRESVGMEVGSRFLCPRGGLCLCWGATVDQQHQIDSFNLYYLALKDTSPRPGSTTRADWLSLPLTSPGRDSTNADSSPRRPTVMDSNFHESNEAHPDNCPIWLLLLNSTHHPEYRRL